MLCEYRFFSYLCAHKPMGKRFQDIRRQLATRYDSGEAQAMGFLLLEEGCGLSQADVLMGKDDAIEEADEEWLSQAMDCLMKGEPIQYVIGHTDFCGLKIEVGKGVLIPRQETEELVDAIEGHPTSILDIGTGSGCIALALKQRFPQAKVTAMDISKEALKIAQSNAERLGLDITFEQRDILKAQPETRKFDLIVSNPPYVCEEERAEMEHHVLDYEPELALFVPDNHPLLFYEAITAYAETALTNGGMLAFETNRRFAHEVGALMADAGFSDIKVKQDVFNNERIVTGCLRKN